MLNFKLFCLAVTLLLGLATASLETTWADYMVGGRIKYMISIKSRYLYNINELHFIDKMQFEIQNCCRS